MATCPSCSAPVPDGSRFCPACGCALPPSPAVDTRTMPRADPPASNPPPLSSESMNRVAEALNDADSDASSSSSSFDHGRFLPGSVIAGRFRIIGLLGKGGMGEVYRADDLKLGQPVALKFLPKEVAGDKTRLARMHAEVRIARQVSHPNVCRVYDIAEVDGQHFLSMEYVDGEDLASLLRRIGRLPKDTALKIAKQLCAGLAAAHDKGVLHRDLKPANVMIDGRGTVRITDFGLAALADQLRDDDVRAGTPAYMAPEQLAGQQVSVRSDLYSLGLVFYKMFTGQGAFQAESTGQLARMHQEETPANPSSLVDDIDPAVERVILRCLEKDPRLRPASVLAVAAALPGGDPLAAALAAGETPAPEMVAAAGDVGGLRPVVAVSLFAAFLAGLVIVVALLAKTELLGQIPLPYPPDVLTHKARDIIRILGFNDPPTDSVSAFWYGNDYLRYVSDSDKASDRWEKLKDGRPAAIAFCYRQSPRHLVPEKLWSGGGYVNWDDPAHDITGMVAVELDPSGRLTRLLAVPPQRDATVAPFPEPDWPKLFTAADLEPGQFADAEPEWVPEVWADARAAWKGTYPGRPDLPLRVEAAAYRGKPVSFELISPWTKPYRMIPYTFPGEPVGRIIFASLFLGIPLGSALLARRNLRLGRGDRRGATRLAFFVLGSNSALWLMRAHHVPAFDEIAIFLGVMGLNLFVAGLVWLLYIALEPFARRRWPDVLISWNRILAGRIRDPLVGRDLLIGGLFAMGWEILSLFHQFLPRWLGSAPPLPAWERLDAMLGVRLVVADLVQAPAEATLMALVMFFLLFLCRAVLRKEWLAAGALVVLSSIVRLPRADNLWIESIYGALITSLLLIALIRFGLLVLVVTLFVDHVLVSLPLTLDPSAWYFSTSLFGLLVLVALAAYGFHTSLAGRPLLRDEFLQR